MTEELKGVIALHKKLNQAGKETVDKVSQEFDKKIKKILSVL